MSSSPGSEKSSNKGEWLGALGLVSALVAGSACASRGVPALRASGAAADASRLSFRVLLPPGYPERAPYPALYFLHDYYGGSATLWSRGVAAELELRMGDGRLAPMVIVAPEGDHAYWSDLWDGSAAYESWVTGKLRVEVERDFAVRRDRAGRAVSGISMGGFGAVKAALRRPELYSSASSLSGALLELDAPSIATYPFWTRNQLARIFGPLDDPRSTYSANDLRGLLAAAEPSALPRFLFRCGREDEYGLAELQQNFAALARERGIDVESVIEPGEHDWNYWRSSLVDVIAWHGAGFERAVPEASAAP